MPAEYVRRSRNSFFILRTSIYSSCGSSVCLCSNLCPTLAAGVWVGITLTLFFRLGVAEPDHVGLGADRGEGFHVLRGGEGVGPLEATHFAEPKRAQHRDHASRRV